MWVTEKLVLLHIKHLRDTAKNLQKKNPNDLVDFKAQWNRRGKYNDNKILQVYET